MRGGLGLQINGSSSGEGLSEGAIAAPVCHATGRSMASQVLDSEMNRTNLKVSVWAGLDLFTIS